jgi:hypothetical protein
MSLLNLVTLTFGILLSLNFSCNGGAGEARGNYDPRKPRR